MGQMNPDACSRGDERWSDACPHSGCNSIHMPDSSGTYEHRQQIDGEKTLGLFLNDGMGGCTVGHEERDCVTTTVVDSAADDCSLLCPPHIIFCVHINPSYALSQPTRVSLVPLINLQSGCLICIPSQPTRSTCFQAWRSLAQYTQKKNPSIRSGIFSQHYISTS